MSDADVSPGEMPRIPWMRAGAPDDEDGALERLLDGPVPPEQTVPALRPLAVALAAARAPAAANELAGQRDAVDAYLTAFAPVDAGDRRRRGVAAKVTALVGSKLALAATAAVAAVGGVAVAGYADALPAGLQTVAHDTIGAPAAAPHHAAHHPAPASSVAPVGPAANRTAAVGLCSAYAKGGLATTSVAYRNLVRAAGGASHVTAYCRTVTAPANRRPGAIPGRPAAGPGHGATHPPGLRPAPNPHATGGPPAS